MFAFTSRWVLSFGSSNFIALNTFSHYHKDEKDLKPTFVMFLGCGFNGTFNIRAEKLTSNNNEMYRTGLIHRESSLDSTLCKFPSVAFIKSCSECTNGFLHEQLFLIVIRINMWKDVRNFSLCLASPKFQKIEIRMKEEKIS